jgi:hypothetical protein
VRHLGLLSARVKRWEVGQPFQASSKKSWICVQRGARHISHRVGPPLDTTISPAFLPVKSALLSSLRAGQRQYLGTMRKPAIRDLAPPGLGMTDGCGAPDDHSVRMKPAWGLIVAASALSTAVAHADNDTGATLLDGSTTALLMGPTFIPDPADLPGYIPDIDNSIYRTSVSRERTSQRLSPRSHQISGRASPKANLNSSTPPKMTTPQAVTSHGRLTR